MEGDTKLGLKNIPDAADKGAANANFKSAQMKGLEKTIMMTLRQTLLKKKEKINGFSMLPMSMIKVYFNPKVLILQNKYINLNS
jgi:hypothetical protein